MRRLAIIAATAGRERVAPHDPAEAPNDMRPLAHAKPRTDPDSTSTSPTGRLTKVLVAIAVGVVAMTATACQDDDAANSAAREEAAAPSESSEAGAPEAGSAEGGQAQDGGNEGNVSFVGAKGRGEGALRDFGTEPSPSEREAIVATVETYTAAAADADGDAACGVMSRALWRDAAAGGTREGCAATYSTLFEDYTPEARDKLSGAEPADVRVKGDHAIAKYTMPGPNWNTLPLKRVGGEWKVDRYGEWSATR